MDSTIEMRTTNKEKTHKEQVSLGSSTLIEDEHTNSRIPSSSALRHSSEQELFGDFANHNPNSLDLGHNIDIELSSKSRKPFMQIDSRIEEQSAYHPELNVKLARALLILGLLVAVSSAAVLVALYLPNHMPTVINDIVTNLSPFYHDLILGCAYGAGALGLFGMLYKGIELHKNKPMSLGFFKKTDDRVLNTPEDSQFDDYEVNSPVHGASVYQHL